MRVYRVETGGRKEFKQMVLKSNKFTDTLVSFMSINEFECAKKISKHILIDSGAFSFQTSSKTTKNKNINKYTKNYIDWIQKNDCKQIQGFFEMDLDIIYGYDQVLEWRKQLMEVSDKIIPVWHKDLGISEFKKMADDFDYISVSCVKNKDILPHQLPLFVKEAHKRKAKIHGLGMTRSKVLDVVPFDSVDSSSWFKIHRFGHYDKKKIDSNYITENQSKLIYLEYLNFIEFWEKYYNKWKWYHKD